MRYLKRFKTEEEWREVSYDEALKSVLGTYKKNAEVLSWLTIGNFIPCRFAEIRVFDDSGNTSEPGEMCLSPEGV